LAGALWIPKWPRPLTRALPMLATLALISPNALALQRLYHDTSLHKPNFRAAAATINAGVQPDDVVLVDGPNPQLVFAHYYTGEAPVHDLRALEGAAYDQVAQTLAEATRGANRAWELLYFHTPGPVQFWLATYGWPAAPRDHNGIRILLYGLPGDPLLEQAQNVSFGPALTLTASALDASPFHSGDIVRVTTEWQVNAPPPDYKFSLRLQDSTGTILLADDYIPQNWFTPTSQWPVSAGDNDPTRDQHALHLPPDLPPGRYLVTLRLYDPANGIAVDATGTSLLDGQNMVAQDVPLGEIEVMVAQTEQSQVEQVEVGE
jgi:hypothetical protein